MRFSVVVSVGVMLRSSFALSTHSPKDLFAFPRYQISLSDQPVLNTTAITLLDRSHQESIDASTERPAVHFLRTASGQAFLCTVPLPPSSSTDDTFPSSRSHDENVQRLERERGLERGVALLEGLRGSCLFLRQGWFTYSLCYGEEIRQFHEARTGLPTPSADPSSEQYSLGQFPASSTPAPTPKYGSGSLVLTRGKAPKVEASLGGEAGEGGRYLVQRWDSGTICDKTGTPRSVEVQYHCNTASTDRIALIRETSTCQYVLLVHTPRLCSEPVFIEGREGVHDKDPPSVVQCHPIVDRTIELVDAAAVDPRAMVDVPAEIEQPSEGTAPSGNEAVAEENEGKILTIVYDAATGTIESATTSQDDMSTMSQEEKFKLAELELDLASKQLVDSIAAVLTPQAFPLTNNDDDDVSSSSSSPQVVVAGAALEVDLIVRINDILATMQNSLNPGEHLSRETVEATRERVLNEAVASSPGSKVLLEGFMKRHDEDLEEYEEKEDLAGQERQEVMEERDRDEL